MDILVVNKSALIGDKDIVPVIAALNKLVLLDFAPRWGTPGMLYYGSAPVGASVFTLQDSLDNPNALAYHVDENNVIAGFIDVKGSEASGTPWPLPLGHEFLETLADPLCSRMAPNDIDIVEVCDPVEEDTWEIDGVPITNFVYPNYFGFDDSGAPWDKMGNLTGPAPVLRPGGYIMQLVGSQWTNTYGDRKGYMANRENGRRKWRQKVNPQEKEVLL